MRESRSEGSEVSSSIVETAARVNAGTHFAAILADPPIAFRAYSPCGEGRSRQKHYRCTPIAKLLKLRIADIAADNCFLFLLSR